MQRTPEGAVAFLSWWVEMYNYVELTGETELITTHSEADCTFCRNFIGRVQPVYDTGGRIERIGETTFGEIVPGEIDEAGYIVVEMVTGSPATKAFQSDGNLVDESPPEAGIRTIAGIQWTSSSWMLTEIAPNVETQ